MNIRNFLNFREKNIKIKSAISNKEAAPQKKSGEKKSIQEKKPSFDAAAFGVIINNSEKIQATGNSEPKKEDKLSFLKQAEITPNFYEELGNLDEESTKRAVSLLQQGFLPEIKIIFFALIDNEEIYNAATDLISKGFNEDNTIMLINNPDNSFSDKYQSYMNLYNRGYKPDIIPEIADLNEDRLKTVDKTINILKSNPNFSDESLIGISAFANADDVTIERTKELSCYNIQDINTLHEIATSSDSTYKKDIALLKKGYQPEMLNEISKLKGKQAEKADILVRKYRMENCHALKYSEAYDNIFSRIEEIKTGDKYNEIDNSAYEYILNLDDENYTELKKLLDEGYKYNDYFYTCNLKTKIRKCAEESRENAVIWQNFINNSPSAEKYKKELNKQDIFFLKHNAFNNKYHTPEEYTDAFIYLKNLKTDKGKNILSCEEFYENILDDAKMQSSKEPLFYNNMKYILSVDPSSVEASYIQTCLELIKEGHINPASIRKLSPDNSLKLPENGITDTEKYSVSISDEMKSDIDTLYETIENNPGKTKEEIDKMIIDNYVKTYDNETDAEQNTKPGEVFSVKGEKFVRIKNPDNKQIPLKLTKETYTELFPPYERFSSCQQYLGDCYCIETMMNIYSDNDTRAFLLKCFEEDENGDISVKIGNYPATIFKNGEFPKTENEAYYSKGAKGFKLLEYAYSETLIYDETQKALAKLDENEKQKFIEFIKEHPHDFFINNNGEKPEIMQFDEAVKLNLHKKEESIYNEKRESYGSYNAELLGNGGLEYNVLKKLGLNSTMYYTGSNKTLYFTAHKTFENIAKQKGVDINNFKRKVDVNEFLNTKDFFEKNKVFIAIDGHLYGITKSEASFYLYNPHNQGFPVKVKDLTELRNSDKLTELTVVPKSEFQH